MRNAIIAVVLIVIVVLAVVFAVRGMKGDVGKEQKAKAMSMPVAIIDVKTFEVRSVPASEWDGYKADPKLIGYKIDGKGQVVSLVTKCSQCKADIPTFYFEKPADGEPIGMGKAQQNYKCPKCHRFVNPQDGARE